MKKGYLKDLITRSRIGLLVWPMRAPKAKFTSATERAEIVGINYKTQATINNVSLNNRFWSWTNEFREQPRLEAVLLVKGGIPKGRLVGKFVPKEI